VDKPGDGLSGANEEQPFGVVPVILWVEPLHQSASDHMSRNGPKRHDDQRDRKGTV
jgi:hypothetical protein